MVELENVVASAIAYDGEIYSLPAPARHVDVMKHMIGLGIVDLIPPDDQGFVTSTGRFVTRQEAANLAVAACQITETKFQPGILFSEDLWP